MEQTGKLDGQARLLLLMNTLYLSSIGLSNTFVNVYLWKVKSDYAVIGLYNMFAFLAIPLAFWVGGHLIKRWDRVISIRLGVLIMAAFYLTVLSLGKSAAVYVIPLGLLLGTGAGFYWLGYYVMYFEITGPDNRDTFNGANGLMISLAAGGAPFLAGWLVTHQTQGYRLIFSLSLLIFVLAVAVSFFIQGRKCEGELDLRRVWADTCAISKWHYVVFSYFFWGIREGVMIFLVGLLVFVISANEFTVGVYALLTSILSLLSYYVVGKWIRPVRRERFLFIGAIMLAVSVLPLLIQFRFGTLLALGIGTALFYPFFSIPLVSTSFDVIGESMEKAQLRVEYIIIREFAFSLGRLLSTFSFVLLVGITTSSLALIFYLLVLNLLLLCCWAFMRHVFPAHV
ncbi:MFS transporter [Aneurinibacillus sp. REN35]|uniref:MFS transporter n=1 Tax=Aneurinibacillus sp. REN35 TaxID=3237286 RepID=UPI0035276793